MDMMVDDHEKDLKEKLIKEALEMFKGEIKS